MRSVILFGAHLFVLLGAAFGPPALLSACGFSELGGLHGGNHADSGALENDGANVTGEMGGSSGALEDSGGAAGSAGSYDTRDAPDAFVRPDAMDSATWCGEASCPVGHGTPSKNTTFTGPTLLPGRLEAENYDVGGEGITYHDTTPINVLGKYRSGPNEAVDVEDACSPNPGVCYDVAAIVAGEWAEYTINVAATGSYSIRLGVLGAAISHMHIEVDGVTASGPITVLDSGGRFVAQDTGLSLRLTQGLHFMRLVFDEPGFSLNWIEFTAV